MPAKTDLGFLLVCALSGASSTVITFLSMKKFLGYQNPEPKIVFETIHPDKKN